MNIIVIDDDNLVLGTVGDLLASAGYSVELFHNTTDALSRLEQGKTDVVITDILMPEMNGVELIRQIRMKHPRLWIIAMSGGGQHVPAEFGLKSSKAFGVNRTILKPLRRIDLLDALPPPGAEQEAGQMVRSVD